MTYWDSLSAAAICIPVMSPAKPETKILRQILLNHLEYSRVKLWGGAILKEYRRLNPDLPGLKDAISFARA